jgi:hypothetical protein
MQEYARGIWTLDNRDLTLWDFWTRTLINEGATNCNETKRGPMN